MEARIELTIDQRAHFSPGGVVQHEGNVGPARYREVERRHQTTWVRKAGAEREVLRQEITSRNHCRQPGSRRIPEADFVDIVRTARYTDRRLTNRAEEGEVAIARLPSAVADDALRYAILGARWRGSKPNHERHND